MCSRNEDCAKCSTFEGKSLAECKNDGRCEVNVLEVEVVSDITKKTGKNVHIAHNVPTNFPLKSRLLKQISMYLNSLLKCSLFLLTIPSTKSGFDFVFYREIRKSGFQCAI